MSEEQKTNVEDNSQNQDVQVSGGKADNSLWKELTGLVRRNKKSLAVLAGVAVILLGVGMLLGALIGRGSASREDVAENSTAETAVAETAEASVPDVPLEENAYPEVNELMEKYYRAAAEGDIDSIRALRDSSEQAELLQIQEKSKYLEGYEDITCYTKPGPAEGSYVVYVSYYAKFIDIEQRVCGLNTYVVCTDDAGSLYIHDCTEDEEMKEYRTNVTKQDDVVDLFNRIQVEYNEAVTGDEELAAFLADLSDRLKTAVGEALADAETEAPAEEPEVPDQNPDEEVSDPVESAGSDAYVQAVDVVRIRKSDSETADVLGKAQVGDEFKLLENKGNGWSRVEYEGQEAYIKSEYLAAVDQEEGGEAQEPEAAAAENEGQTAPAAGEGANTGVPDSGTYRLTTTVNIRKSANETSDRIGVGYSGDEVEILMKQADGWTKVSFKGQTGYIKTEVLK